MGYQLCMPGAPAMPDAIPMMILMEELHAMGYNKYRHSFLKQEVAVIVKYLGEP